MEAIEREEDKERERESNKERKFSTYGKKTRKHITSQKRNSDEYVERERGGQKK